MRKIPLEEYRECNGLKLSLENIGREFQISKGALSKAIGKGRQLYVVIEKDRKCLVEEKIIREVAA